VDINLIGGVKEVLVEIPMLDSITAPASEMTAATVIPIGISDALGSADQVNALGCDT
jgi:hypothetical protein